MGRIASNLSNRDLNFIGLSEIGLQLLFLLEPACLRTLCALQGDLDMIKYCGILFLVLPCRALGFSPLMYAVVS